MPKSSLTIQMHVNSSPLTKALKKLEILAKNSPESLKKIQDFLNSASQKDLVVFEREKTKVMVGEDVFFVIKPSEKLEELILTLTREKIN